MNHVKKIWSAIVVGTVILAYVSFGHQLLFPNNLDEEKIQEIISEEVKKQMDPIKENQNDIQLGLEDIKQRLEKKYYQKCNTSSY